MIVLEDIRTKLITEIKNSGMSQKVIADKLGIRQQTVSCYLSGKKMPALDTFANLCKVLGLDANEILCVK